MTTNGKAVHEASPETDDSLLAQYGFSDLPAVFNMQSGVGVIQEKDACYECMAEGYYGINTHATWYQIGEIIVTGQVPNEHLRPLNRAAALKWARWHSSLPMNRVAIDVGDMAEAAQQLSRDPQAVGLSPLKWQEAVTKLATELKLRREGKSAMDLPLIGHNFRPSSGGNAPPMLGVKHSDMSQRGPGETRIATPQLAGPAGARRATPSAPQAMAAMPHHR